MEATTNDMAEMRQIVTELNEAARAYYSGLDEKMTDFEWDALFDKLKQLEESTGVVLDDSPTRNVSDGDSPDGEKEAHEFPALSLAKTKSVAELAKWADGRSIWLSWKLDGLTLVASYDGGRLVRLLTRGDGTTGTNITGLAPAIKGVLREIPFKGHLVVRGEAVISYADFEELASLSNESWANPRNLASGSLSLKDQEQVAARRLQWIPFTPVFIQGMEDAPWGEKMSALESFGFCTVQRELVSSPDVPTLQDTIDRWTLDVTQKRNPFPVDGLVICYDDSVYARSGTVTGHHATRAGLAFKWADETASTTLDKIEWSCAVASISPVAMFEPVQLEGTTVKRASLCNISECERLGIGGRGTRLSVIKANKIIPKVVEVTEKSGELSIPDACPVCGAKTEIRVSASGTKTLRCTNIECPAKELRKFMRFVSKEGMDIDGLAGETIAKFINRGWLKTPADIYRLGEHADEISAMEGFGAKSALNIRTAVEAARRRNAANILVALSIPLCGRDVARRLLGAHESLRALLDSAKRGNAAIDDFAQIDGIGETKARSFVEWCGEPGHAALVDDLLGLVEVEEFAKAAAGGRCTALTFVVTGDLAHYANRAALKGYIEAQGGKVAGSVSAKTDFLINNDAVSQSGKNKKAKELGIPVITEEEFISRFGE